MGSRFYFEGSDDSGSEFDGNGSSLPFPKPLARSAFLEPSFDPTTFLANLSDRYQTLEDLRNELRELSQSLSKELLDLVNDNYQDFRSLGSTLRGGEERVEEVRVGLLGFQRDLTSVRGNVEQRRENMVALIEEGRKTTKRIKAGKLLLEIAEQIEDLEAILMIGATRDGNVEGIDGQTHDFSDESDEDVEDSGMSMRRLERHVEQYLILRVLLGHHNPTQPYILAQSDRIARIKSALSLDLEGGLKQLKSVQNSSQDHISKTDRLTELIVLVNEKEQPTKVAS